MPVGFVWLSARLERDDRKQHAIFIKKGEFKICYRQGRKHKFFTPQTRMDKYTRWRNTQQVAIPVFLPKGQHAGLYYAGMLDLQNSIHSFRKKGAVILGVSKDSVASHKKFEEKQSSLYAIVRPRSFLHTGIRCMAREEKKLWEGQHGVVRTTYLIDEEGMIVQAYDKSKTAQKSCADAGVYLKTLLYYLSQNPEGIAKFTKYRRRNGEQNSRYRAAPSSGILTRCAWRGFRL